MKPADIADNAARARSACGLAVASAPARARPQAAVARARPRAPACASKGFEGGPGCRCIGACPSRLQQHLPARLPRSISTAAGSDRCQVDRHQGSHHSESLVKAKVVRRPKDGVRLLGRGELKSKLTVRSARRFEIRHRGGREGGRHGQDPGAGEEGRRRGGVTSCVIARLKRATA